MEAKKHVYNENPLLKANCISRLFFWYVNSFKIIFYMNIFYSKSWVSPLMALGQTKAIKEEDLFKPLPTEESEWLTNRFEK
jgi:hypothetical protein